MLKPWSVPCFTCLLIFVGTWGLLRDSLNYAIDAVPGSIDIPAIKQYLMGLDSVDDIHDLHVWPLSTTETALTVHLVVKGASLDNKFLKNLQQNLHDRYGIEHSTIQVESSAGDSDCMLSSDRCI